MTSVSVEVDLFDDNNKPFVAKKAVVYIVRYPRPAEISRDDSYYIYVEVDDYDYAEIAGHSMFRGKSYKNMDYDEKREVWEFLIEWEILEWRKIGPEDSELFTTQQFRDSQNNPDVKES